MMRDFYKFSHKLIEEAAALEEQDHKPFFQIVLPLTKPARNNIYFYGNVNNYLTLLIMSIQKCFTLPPRFEHLLRDNISYWNYIMAASMIFTL